MEKAKMQKKVRREKRKDAGHIVLASRITEKGSIVAQIGAYVFVVAESANKRDVARAVEELFKVHPRRVRTVRTSGKQKYTRGTNRWGRKAETKKAYVYLRKGETIDIS